MVLARQVPHTRTQPPAPPRHRVDRPRLSSALDAAAAHGLVLVCAAPGFGKTTALAAWAAGHPSAWYTVDARDGDPAVFVAGLLAAVGRAGVSTGGRPVPGPATAEPVPPTPLGPQASEQGALSAAADLVAETLDRALTADLTLVLDDADALGPDWPGWALLTSLYRQRPRHLRLVLATRGPAPTALAGTRRRGPADLDSADLAFTRAETAALLAAALDGAVATLVDPVHRSTGGEPWAVRLTADALATVPPAGRLAWLGRHRTPAALAATAVAGRAAPLRALTPLPFVTADLVTALEITADLADLAGRGLLEPVPGGFRVPERYRLGGEPPPAAAAAWYTARGRPADALCVVRGLADPGALAAHLAIHGPDLLAAGEGGALLAAVEAVPDEHRTPALRRLAGEACQVRGDWAGAEAWYRAAAAGPGPLDPGLAWRLGLVEFVRGDVEATLATFGRGAGLRPSADLAQLRSWAAAVHWFRGDIERCRVAAAEALELALIVDDDRALAVAHTTCGMLAAADGDVTGYPRHYAAARRCAERADAVIPLLRVRNHQGNRWLEEGRCRLALAEFDEVIRLAEPAGYASLHALARHNRGQANAGLGRFDEALADFATSLGVFRDLASPMMAYPLVRRGDIHRQRGDLHLARAAYEEAIATGDDSGAVAALAGLIRLDPHRADALLERALARGPGTLLGEALLAAGWAALATGDVPAARAHAEQAGAYSRARNNRRGLAEAIELEVLAAGRPEQRLDRLAEAAALRCATEDRYGLAVNALVRVRLAGQPAAAAEQRLRAMGVHLGAAAHAAGPLRWLRGGGPATCEVHTLGRFVVVRDGVAVGADQWRSKKARELVKLLIARRGRPVSRETLAEALWPGERPEHLTNRLATALSSLRAVLDPTRRFDENHYVRADRETIALGRLRVDVLAFLAMATEGLRDLRTGRTDRGRVLLAMAESGYTGDFLDEDPYADWAAPLRDTARAVYLHVARTLADLAGAGGETDQAAQYLLRLLERDPYDGEAHLRLVRVLRAAGRAGEARRRYRAYLARMAELDRDAAAYPS